MQLFQKAGTVIVLQDADNTTAKNQSKGINLSIAIMVTTTPRARGFVYIEGAEGTNIDTEYHEIYAEENIITFKKQDVYS